MVLLLPYPNFTAILLVSPPCTAQQSTTIKLIAHNLSALLLVVLAKVEIADAKFYPG